MVSGPFTTENSPLITLRDLTSPLLRHKRMLVTTFLLVFSLVSGFGFLKAHSLPMLVNPQRPPLSDLEIKATLQEATARLIPSRPLKVASQSFDEAGVRREAQADEQSYLSYLSRREQQPALNKPASQPHRPASTLFLALILAALVSVPTAHILNYFDPFFHNSAEVVDLLGIPLVVEAPKWTV